MGILSIYRTVELIFRSCAIRGKFLSDCDKVNYVPVHTKVHKQLLKISKSSSAAGRTGRRPVEALVKAITGLKALTGFKALTGRRPVRPVADDDFEIPQNCQSVSLLLIFGKCLNDYYITKGSSFSLINLFYQINRVSNLEAHFN